MKPQLNRRSKSIIKNQKKMKKSNEKNQKII